MPEIMLKPCPFCGGEAKLHNEKYFAASYSYIQCKKCGVKTKPVEAKCNICADEVAAQNWNRQTERPQRQGNWELHYHPCGASWHCSECDNIVDLPRNFCSECGAKMERGADE